MNCPNCGAAMRLEADKDYLFCEYCATLHFPDPNSDGVRVLDELASQDCPICTTPLIHAAIGGHRVLYCSRCRGMLVSIGVFGTLVEDVRSHRETSADAVRAPDLKELDRRIRCPSCKAEMDTHRYGGPGNVVIDTCENCLVHWLDHSELERVVRAPDRRYGDQAGDVQ